MPGHRAKPCGGLGPRIRGSYSGSTGWISKGGKALLPPSTSPPPRVCRPAHQIREPALDGLTSWFESRQVGLLRQSVYSRLAGYEDTNDAERLADDPTMRVVVGDRGIDRPAASTNTMSRFETEVLTQDGNVEGLGRLNAKWVDGAMSRTPHRRVILDMDSSESPVHGEQEGASYNGHFGSTSAHLAGHGLPVGS